MPLANEPAVEEVVAPAAVPKKPEVKVFAVEEGRPQYKGTVKAKVIVNEVWFDEGYMRATKGAIVSLDKFDAEALVEAKQVEL